MAHLQKVVITALLLLPWCFAGCQQKEPNPPLKIDAVQSHATQQETTVVVPDSVRGAWKAVKIAVIDKVNVKETVYTIPVGGSVSIPGSSITIGVESFLPAFVIEGSVMTSSSNELKNPGAKVTIIENGKIIFKGWLFTRFPTTHAFTHPNYGFSLVDVVPAR